MMMDAILKGLAISLLLIFSVGPVVFTIIKQSINHGRKGGFSFIIGVWISDIIWVVLSNGFSEVTKLPKVSVYDVIFPLETTKKMFKEILGINDENIKIIEIFDPPNLEIETYKCEEL